MDLATLSTSVSYFPEASRDNFGHPFAFLEYDSLWNVGDRTALASTGWFEPYEDGSKYYTFGSFFNRPDRTMFYLGYRQIDPLNSRAVLGSRRLPVEPALLTSMQGSATTSASTRRCRTRSRSPAPGPT